MCNKQHNANVKQTALAGLASSQQHMFETLQTTPLEWAELWAAMRANPSNWIPTTGHMYDEMLGVVPPRALKHNRFLVGEADHHNNEGSAVYACFRRANGEVFARYLTVSEYHTL